MLTNSIDDDITSLIDDIIQKIEADLTDINSGPKKKKKSVNFCHVDLYMFNRTQGFECIPSDGTTETITLGMSWKHAHLEKFDTLDDFLSTKRSEHLAILEEEKEKITKRRNEIENIIKNNNFFKSKQKKMLSADMLVPEYSEEEANKILAVVSNKKNYESIDVDLPVSTDLFCPILNNAERYEKLFEEGLSESEIDKTEAEEILEIQESREVAGCKCGQMGLECRDNKNCSCWSNGIGCQVDRQKYPCGCSIKNCSNPHGLKRFDQRSVLAHWEQVLRPVEKKLVEAKPNIKRKRKRGNFTKVKKRKVN